MVVWRSPCEVSRGGNEIARKIRRLPRCSCWQSLSFQALLRARRGQHPGRKPACRMLQPGWPETLTPLTLYGRPCPMNPRGPGLGAWQKYVPPRPRAPLSLVSPPSRHTVCLCCLPGSARAWGMFWVSGLTGSRSHPPPAYGDGSAHPGHPVTGHGSPCRGSTARLSTGGRCTTSDTKGQTLGGDHRRVDTGGTRQAQRR